MKACDGVLDHRSIKALAERVLIIFVAVLFSTVLWISPHPACANQTVHPLEPPDTSSPRATLSTFLEEMNKAVEAYKAGHRDAAFALLERAVRCLNLDKEPPAIRGVIGVYSALYLKETLDRIEIPPLDAIPDAASVDKQKLSSWTLPHTEITIAAAKNESVGGGFLFTPDTVNRTEEFYKRVKNLPYRSGAKGALFEELGTSMGPMVPQAIAEHLPTGIRAEIFGQALWQWIGVALCFIVGGAVVVFVYRNGLHALGILDARFDSTLRHTLGGLILPIMLMLFAQAGLWFVVYGLHVRAADVYSALAFVFLLISYLGRIWLIGALLNRAAAVTVSVCRFKQGDMRAQLVRFNFDVLTVVVVVAAAVNLGARLGLPTYSLITGLGIGGLAVALAGREALSNLIGTIAILLDQPFKVGDFIVLGEGDRGAITDIGLRSTRMRTLDGILVSIPNATMAKMKIVNESAPIEEARIRVSIGAAYGSPLDEVDQALIAASRKCEYVVPEPAPSVRLVKFGDSSVEFQLLVWIVQPEFRGRATNQLNRAICEEFRMRGIQMPFPQREVHIRRDTEEPVA